MSKLLALLSIPVGFALVRSITANVKDDKSQLTPLIPPSPVTPTTFVPLIPTFTGPRPVIPLPDPGPTKFKVDIPEGIVPFFPKGAGDPSLLKPVAGLAGLAGLPKFGDISKLNFQTGLFDPAVQARLRARQ